MSEQVDPNLVEILVDGMSYRGWTDVTVTAALDEAARSFSVQITEQSPIDEPGEFMGWPIMPGNEVSVRLGGKVAVTGYVDARQSSYSFSAHGVQVDGRSKTADAIDSSVDEPRGEFKKIRLDALAKRLAAAHGISVKVEGDAGEPFDVVRIQPGETAFETIDRLARMRGLIVTDDAEGGLVIRKDGGEGGAQIMLIEGENILSGRATFREDQKYSKVKVKAQRPRASEDDEAADGEDADGDYFDDIEAEAEDKAVKRKRTLVIVAEEPGDKNAAQERAEREVAKRKAETIEAGITVQGFFSSPGKLWAPGDKVHVSSPMLHLDRALVVKSITFKQSFSGGSTTELTLTIPEALTSKGKGKGDGKSSDPAEGGDYWKEGGKAGGTGRAAKPTGKTPSRGGTGGKSFPVSDYWSDRA